MHVNSSSKLYREISTSEIQVLQEEHLNSRRIVSATALSGGLFNTTYLLELCDNTKLVLRLGPINQHLLMPFEHHVMLATAKTSELFQVHGIPTAHVIAYDETLTNIDRSYLLMEYISGKTLYVLEPSLREQCYLEAGLYTQRIHSIQGKRFGRLADIASGGGHDSWSAALNAEVQDYISYADRYGLFNTKVLSRIDTIYRKYAPILDEIATPYLTHGDLWPANIITDCTTTSDDYHIVAIIDTDRAMFGDPDFDFPAGHVPNEAFRTGYGGEITQNGNAVTRHKLYALLYSMLGCYALRIQHNQEQQRLRHRKQIDQLLQDLL